MNSPDVALSLAYCPMEVESFTSCSEKIDPRSAASETMNVSTRAAASTEDKQDDSAMTEELTSRVVLPGNRNYVEEQPVPVADWPSIGSKENEGLERMGSGTSTVSGSAGSGGPCEDSRRLSMPTELGKLPSSQYKGVVPQPNGRWGAQIYEKHQRVWLGTFNREEDAAKAYDRAALKFRGRDAMTNFRAAGDGDPEARFLSDHTKGEIIDMLRKHTYEEELDHHDKKSVAVEVYGAHGSLERSVHGDHPENDVNDTVSLPREHLFDKAVTPSDVGKLNRLVIPKQHAEKYFPLDINANEKGLLLNFEDNAGKVWRFRYSYWNSSQSYVLTKGWSRFVKDNKLQAGDIVSFQRSTAQLYICWRRRPAASYPSQSIKGVYPHFHSPAAGTSPAMVTFNPQWMHIFSMDAFNYSANHAVNDRAGAHELWSQPAPATASIEFPRPQLNDTILPFTFFTANQPPPDRCFSRLPRSLKPATQDGPGDAARFPLIQPCMDLYLPVNNNSVCWNDQNINISTLPFTKLTDPSAELAQQFGDCRNRAFAPLEIKAGSSFDPATSKKGVRLFGVNLDDRRPHSNRSPSTPRAQSASACSPCKDDQDEFCSLRKRQFSDPHHHIISAMEEITGSKKSCI